MHALGQQADHREEGGEQIEQVVRGKLLGRSVARGLRRRRGDGNRLLPFSPSYVRATADRAWNLTGISRVTLHECRHGYASFLDAAGGSEARADRYLGHAETTVSDRYRHRLRGQLATDATLLDDEYLVGSGKTVIFLTDTDPGPRRSRASA